MTSLRAPSIILFDWHGTLVDTSGAMYQAMDDMLSGLGNLGLERHLIDTAKSKSPDDGKLVDYVRKHHRLHPKVVADRKASRTDLLEVLFGGDAQAKDIANREYSACYRHHYGDVKAFEPGIHDVLCELRELGLRLGILTNRSREFLDKELETIEQGSWGPLFDTSVSGGGTEQLKPSPAPVFRALENLGKDPGADVWYVGDSTSDTIAAKTAGITNIFFNGARGSAAWIKTVYPGTTAHPHLPDYIVNSHRELAGLVDDVIASDEASSSTLNPPLAI